MGTHSRNAEQASSPLGRAWSTSATLEDAYAIFVGSLLFVAGLAMLSSARLITGGLSGIALLISYFVPIEAGILLMILSLPFFLLAGRAMGRSFLVKTVTASLCLSILSGLTPLDRKSTRLNSSH